MIGRRGNPLAAYMTMSEQRKKSAKVVFPAAAVLTAMLWQGPFCVQAATFRNEEISVGSEIEFGCYEQDNDTGEEEPIVWRVLAIEDREALLISQDCLDVFPYHMTQEETVWSDCDLRSWLNSEFLMRAFDTGEQDLLLEKGYETEENLHYETDGGEPSEDDRVFILSHQEVLDYFDGREDRIACASKWAAERDEEGMADAYVSEVSDGCFWWLRTPGETQEDAECIGAEGSILFSGYAVTQMDVGVRPAIWVKIKD